MRRLLLLLPFLALTLHAQEPYPLGPDSQVQNVPHGTVEKLVLPPGKFFPGTPHNYAVYLPANAPATPLPYMIFLDGSSYLGNNLRAANVLDNLIAAKAIPPMAAIFVDPGVLPAIRPDAQNRYERVFEYDSLSNRYVNFLEEELIPEVAKKHALSTNPDEHAIGGTSTGAVGAFVAAWHRPDQFHRVLSVIGTYVAMKGADTLPEIVRKTEAKPIRIWMQDGANDHITAAEPYGTFYAGTWPRANQLLFDALQFQGYDAKLTIGTGGHDTKQGGAELPDALRWLWRDYSADKGVGKIEARPPAALDQPGWDKRGSVWATVEGINNWEPIPIDTEHLGEVSAITIEESGSVLAHTFPGKDIRVSGVATSEINVPDSTTWMAVVSGTSLFISDPIHHVIRKTSAGTSSVVVAQNVMATTLLWDGHQRIYFLDSSNPERPYMGGLGFNGTLVRTLLPLSYPTSFAFSTDNAMLAVSTAADRYQWSMQLQADGTPAHAEPFYRLEVLDDDGGATGAAFDSIGQVYFATALGVQVCEANGRTAMILDSPVTDKPVESVAFGGPDRDWLYVIAEGKLFRRKMKVHGVPVDKPEKPPQPPL